MKVNGVHKLTLIVALAIAQAAAAGEIQLKGAASVAHDQPITLGDVATLKGADAQALAGIVLRTQSTEHSDDTGLVHISMRYVREILDEEQVNWGKLAISGDDCVVRVRGAKPRTHAVQKGAEQDQPYDRGDPAPVLIDERPTVRNLVAKTLARHYDVRLTDLKILYRESDQDFLDRVEWHRRVEIRPTASGRSGVTPIRIRFYEDERIVDDRAIRVTAEVRKTAVLLATDVRRGETISERHVRVQDRWLSPGSHTMDSIDEVVGQKVRSKLHAGALLHPEDLEPPVLIRRGELVNVKCLSGSIVLSARARAMADGAEGELIELRLDGSKKSFLGRVDARGRAIVDVDQMRGTARAEGEERGASS